MKLKIDHVNMRVKNLDESVSWYSNVFGFEKVEEGRNAWGRWAILALDDNMLCMGEENDEPMREGEAYPLYHFGLRVSNGEEWTRTLEEKHIPVSYGGVVQYPSSKSWYVVDPSGHEIEVSFANNEALKFPKLRSEPKTAK